MVVYDEFANKMGVQSFICDKLAKFADEIFPYDQKRLVFELIFFSLGVLNSPITPL